MAQHKLFPQLIRAICLYCFLGFTVSTVSAESPNSDANNADLNKAEKAIRMQQFDLAFSVYEDLANAGNAEAQSQLANMLLRGLGTSKNEKKAIFWLNKAAEQSHPRAQFSLSQLLPNDSPRALELLTASAEQGYSPARIKLNRTESESSSHLTTAFETQWLGAARKDQKELMQGLLTNKNQLNTEDGAGRTALFYAAEFGSKTVLNWLIEQGIDVNHRDRSGLTAIHTAVHRGNTAIIQRLLQAGSDPTQTFSNGDNLLHSAIRLHKYKLVTPLINAGVALSQHNNDGWSPLDLAEFQKATDTVNLLKNKGAKPGLGWQQTKTVQNVDDILKQLEKESRLAPAAMAIINNNEPLLNQILQKKPEIANDSIGNESTLLILATKQNKPKMINLLITHGANVNNIAENGSSALEVAVRLGYKKIVTTLLDAGASPTQVNKSNNDAVATAISEEQTEIVSLLLDHLIGESDDFYEIRDKLKVNSIPINRYVLLAVEHKSDSIVERLLPFATPTPTIDKQHRSALWYAAKHRNPEMIERLLKAGVSPTLADALGRTPLMIAVEQGCLVCAQKLAPVSNVDHKSNNGNTALILAALLQDSYMTAWLIQNNVDIDARNQRGDTALIVAVKGKSLKIAKILISAKANPARKNKLGFSAMDLAEGTDPEMVKLLQKNLVFGVF